MPTVINTSFMTEAYILVEADWTDIPEVEYARIERRNTVTGEIVTLRPHGEYDAAGNMLLSCGKGIWWDTEPPLDVALEYCTFAAPVPTFLNSNPFFEVALAPWTGRGSAAVRSNLFSHEGLFSAQITPDGTSPTGGLLNAVDSMPFVAGLPVTLQTWALSPQGWNAVFLQAQIIYDDGAFEEINSNIEILDDGIWQYIRHVFTPTKPGRLDQMSFLYHGTPPNTTLFYVDEIGVLQDQEVPIVTPACDTSTIFAGSIFLKNPLNPCFDLELGLCDPAMDFDCEEDSRITYAGMADDELAANTVLSLPTNRVYPIPINRQRRAPTSELRVIAHDCVARDQVLATNQPGTPLLFQAPEDYCIPDRYFSVATVTESRISRDQREDFRLISMPYAVVARPEGPANGICGARFEDLCDIYTSWQSMTLADLQYSDLVLGLASNEGPFSTGTDFRTWTDVNLEFVDWTDVTGGGTRDWDELRDGL